MFLANENFPAPSISYLRDNGFDVLSIQESYPGISDIEVVVLAQEQGRTILTFDSDYGELIFKYALKNPPSVVYFRSKGNNPEAVGKLFLDLLNITNLKFTNSFTVIESDSIRQRCY